MTESNDFARARKAAFDATVSDFSRRYGAVFNLAWMNDENPDLDRQFLEAVAQRLEGRSLRALGRALAPSEPSDWYDERSAWNGALGSWALHPLADQDRARLVGIAHVLGLDKKAKRLGLRW